MLTTEMVLMSLGTEPANSHHVSSEQTDTGGGSFAKSFDEGIALAGETQPPITDGKDPQNGAARSTLTAQDLNVSAAAMTGTKANADAKVLSELSSAIPLVVSVSADGIGTASGGAKIAAAAIGERQQGERLKANTSNMPTDVQLNVSGAGSVQGASQKPLPAEVDAPKIDVGDGTVVPPTGVAASTTLISLDNSQKSLALNQKVTEIAEKDPAVSIKKAAEGISKTAKAAKSEKNEKAVGIAGNTTGIEAQIQMMLAVPGGAASMSDELGKPNASQKNADLSLSASISTTNGQSAGLPPIAGKDKASASADEMDGAKVKGVVTTTADDPASLKSGSDAAKMATQPVTSVSAGSAKGQGGVAVAAAPALTRAEGGIAGVISGVVTGSPAAHIISAKSQGSGLNSSLATGRGGTGTLVGAGAADGGIPVDTTHRTLTASPTVLEVGVPNGTHGWLKIRAEMAGGGVVNASLSTASFSGQEMLHRELPSLTAYLQSERVAVNTVIVQPAVTAGGDFRGLAGGMNGDGRGQAQQSGGQGGGSRQDTSGTALNRTEDVRPYTGVHEIGEDELLSSVSYVGGGSWLSVRA